MLLVTDKTIYQDHQVYANTTVQNLVFLHMRSYFAHYMNGVNEIYSNALRYDPDIRINILLTNLLFLTVREFWIRKLNVLKYYFKTIYCLKEDVDCQWTNWTMVGLPTISSYRGRKVILDGNTLVAFRNYMQSKSFTFAYDHAVGLFKLFI